MKKSTYLFILIEILLYFSFLILDIKHIDSTYIKYAGILLCFVYTLIERSKYNVIALFFTCLADLFLLVINKYYLIGVILFLIVQVTYIFYLDSIKINTNLRMRVMIPLVGCVVLALTNSYSTLNVFTLYYFSQLVITTFSIINKKHKLLCFGLCLFICCDICVGLHNLFPSNFLIAFGQWLFYLPSQVIISIKLQ